MNATGCVKRPRIKSAPPTSSMTPASPSSENSLSWAKAATTGQPSSLAMPCSMIIKPVMMRSTLSARGAHAAIVSVMYVPQECCRWCPDSDRASSASLGIKRHWQLVECGSGSRVAWRNRGKHGANVKSPPLAALLVSRLSRRENRIIRKKFRALRRAATEYCGSASVHRAPRDAPNHRGSASLMRGVKRFSEKHALGLDPSDHAQSESGARWRFIPILPRSSARLDRNGRPLLLAPLDLGDLVGLGAAGCHHLDGGAFLLADEGARQGRGDGDLALLGVGLDFPDDLPDGLLLGVLVDDGYGGAEFDGVAGEFCDVDDVGARELVLQLGYAALVVRLLFLRGVILRVFRQVAMRARFRDVLDDARTILGLAPLQFFRQGGMAGRGHRNLFHHLSSSFDRAGPFERPCE